MKPSRLLTHPSKWCRLAHARDAEGGEVGTWDPRAVQWDLLSSISRYTGLPVKESERRIRATEAFALWAEDNQKAEFREPRELWAFNDTAHWWCIQAALEQANL